jgi:hypothetical protein
MKSCPVWLLGLSLWCSSAYADAAPPVPIEPLPGGASTAPSPGGMISVPPQIPAGGVVPLIGFCRDADCSTFQAVTVSDAVSHAEVTGHVELTQADFANAWGYFVPDAPLVQGMMLSFETNDPYYALELPVEVVASEPLVASAATVYRQLTRQRESLHTVCCPTLSASGRPRCLEDAVRMAALFQVHVEVAGAAATQYAFKLEVRDVRAEPVQLSSFQPLFNAGLDAMERFDGEADSYCYAVRAQPLTGGAIVDLVEECVDNELEGIGEQTRSPEEVAQWLTTCPAAPGDAGVPPGSETDADVEPNEHVDADAASSPTPAGGCQLHSGTGHGLGSMLWLVAAALGLVRSTTRCRGFSSRA